MGVKMVTVYSNNAHKCTERALTKELQLGDTGVRHLHCTEIRWGHLVLTCLKTKCFLVSWSWRHPALHMLVEYLL